MSLYSARISLYRLERYRNCPDSRFLLERLKQNASFISLPTRCLIEHVVLPPACLVSDMSYNKRPNLDSSFDDDDDDEIPPAKKSKVIESDDEDIDLMSSSDVETDESFVGDDPDYTPDTDTDSANTSKEGDVSVIVVEEKKENKDSGAAAAAAAAGEKKVSFISKIWSVNPGWRKNLQKQMLWL